MFERAESELGPIKALVNNAAVTGGFARVEEVSSAAIANVFAVNVSGTILCSREAVRRMSTRRGGTGGAIVNISSRAAHAGSAGEWVHYAASKGAIDSFTIGLAREVATEGIRVNAVAPGLVDTGLHAANGNPGRLQRLMGTIPMGRPGTPREVGRGSVVAVVSRSVVHDGSDFADWRRAMRGRALTSGVGFDVDPRPATSDSEAKFGTFIVAPITFLSANPCASTPLSSLAGGKSAAGRAIVPAEDDGRIPAPAPEA